MQLIHLGLKDTENYKTLYDQKGEEVMWVVMASEPFALKPKEWKFPVIGSVPYKGFFKKERADSLEETNLKKKDGMSWSGIPVVGQHWDGLRIRY